MNVWFWSWISLVVVFALGEAFTGGLLILPWALGAAVAALFDALRLPVSWQWIAFLVVSCVLTVLGQRLIIRRRD
jgi:membrane protein implicated in regulation of membrane protease activity